MPTSEVLAKRSRIATLVIVSLGLFMVVLDNLVVNVALPTIHRDFGASVQSLEWIVNAYVLAYAVLLLTGSVLGDRFGRKRMFIAGILLFTAASAGSALAPTTGMLIAARALQGVGAAIVTPLTLTLIADAFPPERRGIALGVWSGISGTAVALGPLVGGAMIQIASWHWIFWINVPVGLVLAPVAARRLKESYGSERKLDLVGLGLSSTGLFGVDLRPDPRADARLVGARGGGLAERRRRPAGRLHRAGAAHRRSDAADELLQAPQLRGHQRRVAVDVLRDVRLGVLHEPVPAERGRQLAVRGRTEAAGVDRSDDARVARGGLLLGALGRPSVHGRGPGAAGDRARVAGGRGQLGQSYTSMIMPFILAGSGMALVFAPSANAVLASVRTDQAGQASGATNAIRELGGVLGISVLSTIFTSYGSYASGIDFIHGLTPAMWVGTAVLFAGALVALVFPFDTRAQSAAAAAAIQADAPAPAPVGVSAPTAA